MTSEKKVPRFLRIFIRLYIYPGIYFVTGAFILTKMKFLTFAILVNFFILTIIAGAAAAASENSNSKLSRKGKWFLARTVTKVLAQKSVVTETKYSSCVMMQSHLPPCRHLRQLRINPSPPTRIEQTAAPLSFLDHKKSLGAPRYLILGSKPDHLEKSSPEAGTKPLSWAEYFGFAEVTVTEMATHSITAKHYDPRTVVKYSVKGCQPTKLPFNLPLCEDIAANETISKELHYAP